MTRNTNGKHTTHTNNKAIKVKVHAVALSNLGTPSIFESFSRVESETTKELKK